MVEATIEDLAITTRSSRESDLRPFDITEIEMLTVLGLLLSNIEF